MLVEGFNDLRSCPTKERGAVFVRSAVLLAEGYLLSVEIWVLRYVCSKWSETFAARVLRCSLRRGFIDEGVERDRSSRVLSCCMTSSLLSIKKKDYSSLLGESLWGDCKGEALAVSIGSERRGRGRISIRRLD